MQEIYYIENFKKEIKKSIFLAGPTPRNGNALSWRPEALTILKSKGYDGTVIIPEAKNFDKVNDNLEYKGIIEFERNLINACDIILFWIPRTDLMPAYTTNIEYGNFIKTGKIVAGSPKEAPKMGYLKHMAKEKNMPWFDTLEATINEAISRIGEGALRQDDEVKVPLNIFNDDYFKSWYKNEKQKGNEIKSLSVEYFDEKHWLLRLDMFIKSDDTVKKDVLLFKN